jgi:hypothetical protein
MAEIRDLTAVSTIKAGDSFPFWSQENGDTMRASSDVMKKYFFPLAGNDSTQYAAPTATGFSVTITGIANAWLILTPIAGYAAGTVVMPIDPIDQQRVTVNCTQAITALTVSGNGKGIAGAPSTIAANGFFFMRYDAVLGTWFRVG